MLILHSQVHNIGMYSALAMVPAPWQVKLRFLPTHFRAPEQLHKCVLPECCFLKKSLDQKSTWLHLRSLDFISFHLMSFDVNWFHLIPFDFIWFHLVLYISQRKRDISHKGKRKDRSGEREKVRWEGWDFGFVVTRHPFWSSSDRLPISG